jgi:hypothetical protein
VADGREDEATPDRFRVSRARLTYAFERYAIGDELTTVAEASERLGLTREQIALLVLQGRLAVAEAVGGSPDERPPRLLLRREVDALAHAQG